MSESNCIASAGGIICIILQAVLASACRAEQPGAKQIGPANWPLKIVVTVGDIRTRVDGPKMWTLSGIEYQNAIMATEDSAYGTVLTIRNVGHLGTAHFLDVPGKPGAVEKEDVTHLQLFVDDKPVNELSPTMNLTGDSFRMERRSKIRALDLETTISLRNGVLTETARFRLTGPIDLQNAYPWMYAWTPQATDYVCGDDQGIQKRGAFLKEGQTVSQVVKNATWMAVFNSANRKGSVCYFLKHPPNSEGSFLLIDAPGVYRKVAAYTLVDQIVPPGFDGTYQSVVGFFTATVSDWEEPAQRRAAELRSQAAR
ncbi:MAG: hypothetical protein ABI614_07810 [Planctomycetota bacterium]